MKLASRIALACLATSLALSTSGCIRGLLGLGLKVAAVKVAFSCIPEGTEIDTPAGARPIESLKPGDEVIGFDGEPVKVLQLHAYSEDSRSERFYRIEFINGAVVDLCDLHRIAGVRAEDLAPGTVIAGQTVQSSTRYSGVGRSYDLLTEDDGYQIDGVPVNSMIEEMAKAARRGRPLYH